MLCSCPRCDFAELVEQDIEELSDSVLLVKTSDRIQLRCAQCGWMGYRELGINASVIQHSCENLKP